MQRTLALLTAVVQLLPSCKAASQAKSNDIAAAREIVSKFLTADTAGRYEAAMNLVDTGACDVIPTTDYLSPSAAVMISGFVQKHDTVLVTVVYEVLGRAWSEDTSTAGSNNWRFTEGAHPDTLVFPIDRGPKGRTRINCGYLPANHPGLSVMERLVSKMDDRSKLAWRAATKRLK